MAREPSHDLPSIVPLVLRQATVGFLSYDFMSICFLFPFHGGYPRSAILWQQAETPHWCWEGDLKLAIGAWSVRRYRPRLQSPFGSRANSFREEPPDLCLPCEGFCLC